MALIFIGSATPQNEIPTLISPVAKLLHVIEYAMLGFILFPLVLAYKKPILSAVILAAAYAITDETHQLFVAGRHGSAIDVIIDTFGSMLGVYVALMWGRR
jgi:VanZ family protein